MSGEPEGPRRVNAMKRPSLDQLVGVRSPKGPRADGLFGLPSSISASSTFPSIDSCRSDTVPSRSASTAMLLPSGDHTGALSRPGFLVSCERLPVATLNNQTSEFAGLPLGKLTATFCWSGDNDKVADNPGSPRRLRIDPDRSNHVSCNIVGTLPCP